MVVCRPNAGRRGAIAPLAAFLTVVLIALVAFAVDVGWVVLARTELQAAADAAALAGADPLMDGYVQYQLAGSNSGSSGNQATILTTSLTNARARAKQFAADNGSGGIASLVLNDSDIEFGFTDSAGNYTAYPTNPNFPNTIKVTLRRDSSANGPLGLFFAKVIGNQSANLLANAGAVIMGGSIDNFNSTGLNISMLPMTYDVNAWNNFVKTGQWPDGTVSLDGNGLPQLQVYPSVKDTGNFGQLSLNNSNVGESTEAGWVDNGMAPSDLKALQSANLIPLSQHSKTSWDWQGSTGLTTSLISAVNAYPGKTFLLPLFTPYNASSSNYQAGTSQGSNYSYNIVQFVAVKIMPNTNNSGVLIEPSLYLDRSSVFSSVGPVDTSKPGPTVTTFTYPRLSQ